MQIGVDSFVATESWSGSGRTRPVEPTGRIVQLLEEVQTADRSGLDVFGIGEHHRPEYLDSSPVVLLSAAAARTKHIRLTSAVTVLSAHDPVRVFQDFATLDLVSQGRAEIVAGRGSFTEAYPLFGLSLEDYDELFREKLELLLKIRSTLRVTWSGQFRPALQEQEIHPRPLQNPLPIWVGVGRSPESCIRAGTLGLPLMLAIIGGQPRRFRPLVDLYREAGRRAGHSGSSLRVGIHALGYVAESDQRAADDYFPGYAHSFSKIGRERGWPPVNRSQYDALLGPSGALIVGGVERVVAKVLQISRDLGGIDRLTFQLSPGLLPHDRALQALDTLGREVAPAVRAAAGSQEAGLAD